MADPNQILTDKRARIASLEAALEMERAELRGMELMAKLIVPSEAFRTLALTSLKVPRAYASSHTEASSKGRQPGSISMRWRAALWRLDALGGDFSPSDIVSVVRELEDRDMRPTDAKRQMEVYEQLGFISAQDGVYNITDEFRSKFADNGQNSSNENVPPNSIDFDDVLGGTETAPDAL